MAHTIPARSEADPRFTWAITDLFSSDDAWREELARMSGMLEQIRGYESHLGESAANLLGFLRLMDEMDRVGDPMISYAFRRKDEDTRNPVYQEMSAQAQNFIVELDKATAFEIPEVLAIDDETMERFYQQEPELEHYRLVLTRIRRKKEHTLSAKEESLLAAAGQMAQSPHEIFSLLNDADMTYPDAVDSEGNKHQVTHGSYIAMMQSPDRTLRESAFRSLYSVYGQFRNTASAVLGAQMKQLQFFADVRKYPSALHAALSRTEVPVEIYHNLIQAVHDNLPAMHRYVRLRKRLLGVDKIHYYDMYTPIVADVAMKVSFEVA